MSLVICSNSAQDGSVSRQKNSIEEAFSFRNALSSTYKIPKNSQVALQSAKLNITGKVTFSNNNNEFYQYVGKKLDLDGETTPQIGQTTSFPLLVRLTESDAVQELSPNDFANQLKLKLNEQIYHPNMKDKIDVELLQNASSLDFKGYKITYDQENDVENNIPFEDFRQWYREDGKYAEPTSDFFSYDLNVFKRNSDRSRYDICAGINTEYPLNLGSGEFVVNLSNSNATANASGKEVEWSVGLSRFVSQEGPFGDFSPEYFSKYDNDDLGFINDFVYMDFGVARNGGGQLVAFHSVYNEAGEITSLQEVKYWENASSTFSGNGARKDLDDTQYTKVKFEAEGERMKAEIFNAATDGWEVITQYHTGEDKDKMFHPIHQACWCLHPVLWVGANASNLSGSMEIETYQGIDNGDYDVTTEFKSGWWETMELLGRTYDTCYEVETRDFNNPLSVVPYVQDDTNASGGVDVQHVLVLEQSDVYSPSFRANAKDLLGFNRGVVDTAVSSVGSKVIFESVKIASLTNNMSLFLRLNNLGQNVVNAFTGNKSKIIAHLTSLETQTGIVSYEPSNLVWLDLDNPADINLTDFDLSFNYINEQYARIVAGQSIVCLYFRDKPPAGHM